MNSFILHGDNQVASREKLVFLINESKKVGFELMYLDNPGEKELLDAASSQGLFGNQNLIVIENFLTSNKDSSGILSGIPKDTTIIIWEKKLLSPSAAKKLSGKFTVLEFKLPTVLFALLDNIFPKNNRKVLELLNAARQGLEAEFLLIMLSQRVRQLLWVKLDPNSLTMVPWQRAKLAQQASKLTSQQLTWLHSKLLEIDRDQKSSQLPENLFSSLELLLTSI